MIRKRQNAVYVALLLALASAPLGAASFVYEGQLDDRGVPANGRYDLQLAVYQDAELGATLAEPMVFDAVEVVDGRFRLEFDAKLEGTEPAWVALAVRDAGGSRFSAIPGRTKATQAPAAIGACWSSIGDSGSNPATNFIGTTDAQAFVVRTANARSLRIEPSAELFGGSPITTNTLGGSRSNSVTAGVRGATIAGGGVPTGDSDPAFDVEDPNRVTDHYGTVGGGYANRAGDASGSTLDRPFATVGGGQSNIASGPGSTVGGGIDNTAGGFRSTVGGGRANRTSGENSTIGGGQNNSTNAYASTVGGGFDNHATGDWSTVSGGYENTASGRYGTVGGGYPTARAETTHGPAACSPKCGQEPIPVAPEAAAGLPILAAQAMQAPSSGPTNRPEISSPPATTSFWSVLQAAWPSTPTIPREPICG